MRAVRTTVVLASAALGVVSALAQQTTVASGVYTAAQAARGEPLYAMSCATCHGKNLVSTNPEAPSLVGEQFAFGWKGMTLAERFARIKDTMPQTTPGTLPAQTVLDIMAFVLKTNGYPAGSAELPNDVAKLGQILIPR